MIVVSFIFKPAKLDRSFEQLNEKIDTIAQSTEGFLGTKSWEDSEGNRAVMYYWTDREALRTFESDPTHKLAKSRYQEWYEGYRVEISEIIHVYGDHYFDDLFPAM